MTLTPQVGGSDTLSKGTASELSWAEDTQLVSNAVELLGWCEGYSPPRVEVRQNHSVLIIEWECGAGGKLRFSQIYLG